MPDVTTDTSPQLSDALDRPAFQSTDRDSDFESNGLSLLALAAFLAGVMSLLAPISPMAIPICILAFSLGIAATVRIRKTGKGGALLAQAAVVLGVMTLAWSFTARRGREQHLYKVAGQHAELFLEYLLDEEKKPEAFELLRLESERQIEGTNLKEYYFHADEETKAGVDKFLADAATKFVFSVGPEANWKFQEGVKNWGDPKSQFVEVKLVNMASESQEALNIVMQRVSRLLVKDEGLPTAHWHVYDLLIP